MDDDSKNWADDHDAINSYTFTDTFLYIYNFCIHRVNNKIIGLLLSQTIIKVSFTDSFFGCCSMDIFQLLIFSLIFLGQMFGMYGIRLKYLNIYNINLCIVKN